MIYDYIKKINIEKLSKEVTNSPIASNIISISTSDDNFSIFFETALSNEEKLLLDELVNNHELEDYTTIITNKILSSIEFGKTMLVEFATNNVINNITQSGKTKQVADYLGSLSYLLNSGSLYAAIEEMDRLITEGVPVELSPYVTEEIINYYKQKILEFLS